MSADASPLVIEVCHAMPDRALRIALRLPSGANVAMALAEAAPALRAAGIVADPERLAIFGRSVGPGDTLVDGDRVELLRPLIADPKAARRERAARGRYRR